MSFILFIFLIPILNIFRYDTTTQELIIFGNVWGLGLKQGFYADLSPAGAFHIAIQFLLKVILPWLLFLALFPLLGYFAGRFFCGWLCPEGAMFELADFLTLRLLGRHSLYSKKPNDPDVPQQNRFRYGIIALLSIIVIPLLGGTALTGYLVAPETIIGEVIGMSPGAKAMIQKHFGKGCFTCPGINMESISFGAMMHNIDPNKIVDEIKEVSTLYRRMDSNFKFPAELRKEDVKPIQGKILDLKGVGCPLNYVKTKLFLETLEKGAIITIYLDEGEPIRNVPASLKNDGHELLEVTRENNHYKVVVKKGS